MAENVFLGQIRSEQGASRMDLLDRKIFYLLCKNARYSDTAIAKALRIRRETVSYRMKRMRQNGLLYGFLTMIDSRRLGFRMHLICMKLKQLGSQHINIDDLITNENITRINTFGGGYDLQIIVTSRTLEEFDAFLEGFLGKFSDTIQDYTVLEIIDENFIGIEIILSPSERKLLRITEKKGSTFENEFASAKRAEEVVRIDEKDVKILKSLRLDGRMPIAELSEKVGLAVPAVTNRIRRLVREEVIKGFIPYGSLDGIGYQWYMLYLQVREMDRKRFLTWMKQHGNVLWHMKLVGKWNYSFSIFAQDNTEFNSILNSIRTEFASNIISYDSVLVFGQQKFMHRVC
ncbi:MAG: Lrp/AsnC family transcriptional regulator [Nanoarchaeota archaeon]|nr:Lrp/AsnC family transcriptional regulator [Nanoarchaeota archaeon]